MLPTPGFHHLHLRSIDPDAAISFYTRQFPTASIGSWSEFPALLSPNDVMVLFDKVDEPPTNTPQSAIWHFGWHVTDSRAIVAAFVPVTLARIHKRSAGWSGRLPGGRAGGFGHRLIGE